MFELRRWTITGRQGQVNLAFSQPWRQWVVFDAEEQIHVAVGWRVGEMQGFVPFTLRKVLQLLFAIFVSLIQLSPSHDCLNNRLYKEIHGINSLF